MIRGWQSWRENSCQRGGGLLTQEGKAQQGLERGTGGKTPSNKQLPFSKLAQTLITGRPLRMALTFLLLTWMPQGRIKNCCETTATVGKNLAVSRFHCFEDRACALKAED